MTTRIQLRRGTATQWYDANPTLYAAEVGVELDTGKIKIGDGTTDWRHLDYYEGAQGPAGPQGSTGVQGPQGVKGDPGNQINKVIDIPDVYSAVGLGEGAVLVYNNGATRWDTKNKLVAQDMDGGEF